MLGGTGTIGSAIVAELVDRNNTVVALSRSDESDEKLILGGAKPFRGDLTDPVQWADVAISCDVIIQVAATFGDDMGDVDAKAMKALMKVLESQIGLTQLIPEDAGSVNRPQFAGGSKVSIDGASGEK